MIGFLRKIVGDTNPLRLWWHKLWAIFAAFLYRFPSRKLKVVFVTGTKGKTTTAWVLGSILQEAGIKTAVATTALFRMGKKTWVNETKMTTLGRFKLQSFLREAVDKGMKVAVVEASSQASTQSRLWGILAEGFVWTNLQEDHLEYHGGWEKYREAKMKIIDNVKKDGFLVLNADDAEARWFLSKADVRRVSLVGTKTTKSKDFSSFKISGLKNFTQGIGFNLGKEKGFRTNFSGEFNAQNIAEALVAAKELGVSDKTLKEVLKKVLPVPGRLEKVENKKGLNVFVDFAYTPKALEYALGAVRGGMQKKASLWVVFGAVAGGRDIRKRGLMGKIAEKGADKIVLTDDDLGEDDDSAEVIEGIVSGFSAKFKKREGKLWWRFTPREKAVEFALQNAKKDDVLLFAGKGCETVQHYGKRQRKYNERKVIEKFLNKK